MAIVDLRQLNSRQIEPLLAKSAALEAGVAVGLPFLGRANQEIR